MFARLFRSALRELVDRLLRWALAEAFRGLDTVETAKLFAAWLNPCRRLTIAIVRKHEAKRAIGRRFWARREIKLRAMCAALVEHENGACAADVADTAARHVLAHLASQRARKGRA